jgi:CBS domain-containing protein
MLVRDIMTRRFETIDQDAAIRSAAQRMRDLDVGMLPVHQDGDIVGTVTDRDITIRVTAVGADPRRTPVRDAMSNEVFACVEDDDLKQAARIMEDHQIRRLMVQNDDGVFTGILSLADLAHHHETERLSARILEEVTQPAGLLRRHHNPRARLGIRIRLVMPQIDAQMAAHIGQLGRAKIPARPRQPHRAHEGLLRRRQPVGLAAGASTPLSKGALCAGIMRRIRPRDTPRPLRGSGPGLQYGAINFFDSLINGITQ